METRTEGSWTVVSAKGEVDLFTAPKLKEQLIQLIDGGATSIIVDLSGLGFMDSTGLGVLVGALKRLKERDGRLALVCPDGPVLRVLTITGLHKVLTIRDSVEAAMT